MQEYFTRNFTLDTGTYKVHFYPEYIGEKLVVKVVVNDWDELYMVKENEQFVFSQVSSLVIPHGMEEELGNCITEYFQ